MKRNVFNVVLIGEIKKGFDKSTVKHNLATLFKLPFERIEILLNGHSLVVKRSVDTSTATKYKATIERAGACCRLEPVPQEPPLELDISTSESPDNKSATPPPIVMPSVNRPSKPSLGSLISFFTKEKYMLQKLENAYLAILRFLVIAVVSILLVAVVILGFNSFKAVQFEPVAKEITPQVSEQELIKGIIEKPISQATETVDGKNDTPAATDPNMAFYERAANAVVAFVSNHPDKGESIEKANVIDITKKRANSFDDPKLVSTFAKAFAAFS